MDAEKGRYGKANQSTLDDILTVFYCSRSQFAIAQIDLTASLTRENGTHRSAEPRSIL